MPSAFGAASLTIKNTYWEQKHQQHSAEKDGPQALSLSKRKEQVSMERPRQKLLPSLQTAERQIKGHDLGNTVMMGRLNDLGGLLQP